MKKYTSVNLIKFISLGVFLTDMVRVQYVEDSTKEDVCAEYYESLGGGINYNPTTGIEEECRYYKPKKVLLIPSAEKYYDNIKQDFLDSLKTIHCPCPENAYWELEDRAVECSLELGEPTFAVNIGRRTWALVDPKDFLIYKTKNNLKAGLVCLNKKRNFIYKYERKNEK